MLVVGNKKSWVIQKIANLKHSYLVYWKNECIILVKIYDGCCSRTMIVYMYTILRDYVYMRPQIFLKTNELIEDWPVKAENTYQHENFKVVNKDYKRRRRRRSRNCGCEDGVQLGWRHGWMSKWSCATKGRTEARTHALTHQGNRSRDQAGTRQTRR